MTATHSIAPPLLVAIDISKHRHEVLIGIPGKKRRRRLTITNTLEDFRRLAISLASYDLPVRIGFEATGNYHRPLAHHLGQAGFELKLVSSVALARTREALHNSWGGATVTQVAQRHEITRSQIYGWRRDLKKKGLWSSDRGAVFLPVDFAVCPEPASAPAPSRPVPVELRLSNGRCLRFDSSMDGEALTRLIRAVDAA